STFITDKGDPFVVGQGLFIAANLPVSAVRYVDWYLNTNPVLQRLEQGEYNGDLLSQYHKKIQRMNPGAVEEPSGEFYKSVGVIDGQMSNGESPYGNGNERPLPAVPQNLALSNPAPPAFPIYRREGWTSVQRYEWTYALQNHAWKGAKPFKDFIDGMWAARGDTFTAPNYSGPNHARYAQVRAFMDANVDVDTTLTSLALLQWMGPWDDSTQNHFLWRRANGKFIHLPWDFDGMFDGSSEGNKRTYSIYVGENGNPSNNFRGPNWFKDTFLKTYRTEYNQRMWELANSFLDPANVSALGFNSIVSFATARRTNVNSQLASLGTYFKPARPTNQQPANLSTVLPPANFVTSPYAHGNATNPSPHSTTKWEIRASTGSYADPAFVLTSTTELTTLAIPFDQLVYGQTYFWRVTYFDADGHPSVVSAETRFNFGNSSPTAGSVVINEVLANNRKAVINGGRFPDYIELKNTTNAPIDLSGWALSDDPLLTSKFLFPPGTTIDANGYLLIWCDNDTLAPGVHSGFALDSSGQTITLTQSGSIRDSVTFGPQAPDLSIGRSPDGTGGFALNEVTPEATNALKTPLGSVNNLHINEWVADANGEDWFELYNADSEPVQIGNLYLSDTSALPTLTRIPALSFIAGKGFADFIADGSTAGANHCDFRLSTAGDTIILTAANGTTTVALATFGAQLTDVSEGRLPDGAAQVVKFPNSATRRGTNYLPAPVVINEALTASTAPLEDAVEIFNPSEAT
ncbi:MAG TPA: lamin tail domain-containing protein, partial [Chthoniobacteraceae bacterium]|nr:lamin tail domain-containing protein [Chthoniobacteraceae bacterium]